MKRWADLRAGGVFWVGAHRGGRDLGPENTLETAALGYLTGAHFWELDVQLSKDDIPVVIHDDTLERTTDAAELYPDRKPWRVRDFLWEEIRPLRPLASPRDAHPRRSLSQARPTQPHCAPSPLRETLRHSSLFPLREKLPQRSLPPLGETLPHFSLTLLGEILRQFFLSPLGDTLPQCSLSPLGETLRQFFLSPLGETSPPSSLSPLGETSIPSPLSPLGERTIQDPLSPFGERSIQDPLSPSGERAGVRGENAPPSPARIPTLREALAFTAPPRDAHPRRSLSHARTTQCHYPLSLLRETLPQCSLSLAGETSPPSSLSPFRETSIRSSLSPLGERSVPSPLSPLGERAGVRGENAPPPPARIPTLREALLFTRALNWPVNVEIKGHPDHHDRLVRETARLISDLEMHAWVLVSSFHHDVLRRLKSLDPRILTGVLTQETIDDPEALIRAVNADTLHPADGKISEALVRRCQAAGIPLIAWTVNDPERLKQLKAWGVSAVITDRPQALMPMIHP